MRGKLHLIQPFNHLLEVGQYLFRQEEVGISIFLIKEINRFDMNLEAITKSENVQNSTNVSKNTKIYKMLGASVTTHTEGFAKITSETRIFPYPLNDDTTMDVLIETLSLVDKDVEFRIKNIGTGKFENGYFVDGSSRIHKDLYDVIMYIKPAFVPADLENSHHIYPAGTKLMVEIEITNPSGMDSIVNPITKSIIKNLPTVDGYKFTVFSNTSLAEHNRNLSDRVKARLLDVVDNMDSIMG